MPLVLALQFVIGYSHERIQLTSPKLTNCLGVHSPNGVLVSPRLTKTDADAKTLHGLALAYTDVIRKNDERRPLNLWFQKSCTVPSGHCLRDVSPQSGGGVIRSQQGWIISEEAAARAAKLREEIATQALITEFNQGTGRRSVELAGLRRLHSFTPWIYARSNRD